MKLTPKQESFCLAYLETGNASEAYRTSYDASKMKPDTVHRSSKELLDNPKITARLQELRAPIVKKSSNNAREPPCKARRTRSQGRRRPTVERSHKGRRKPWKGCRLIC